MYFYTEL